MLLDGTVVLITYCEWKRWNRMGLNRTPIFCLGLFTMEWKKRKKEWFHSTPTSWRARKKGDFPSYCTQL